MLYEQDLNRFLAFPIDLVVLASEKQNGADCFGDFVGVGDTAGKVGDPFLDINDD